MTTLSRKPLRFLLAVAIPALALLLRKVLPIAPGVGLYPLPLAAIILSAWLGGRGPGWLATAISAVGIELWLLPAGDAPGDDRSKLAGLAVFLVVALLSIEFSMGRRRAERGLREREARLRQIAETTPSVLWVAGQADLQPQYVNPSFARIWGLAGGPGGLPSPWPPALHPEDEARVRAGLSGWAAGAGGEPLDVEYRIVRPDGATRWIHDRAAFVQDEPGQPRWIIGIAEDITGRKRAEQALRRSEAYLAETQRLSHSGSWACAPGEGETRYLSEECRRILDLDPGEEPPPFRRALLGRAHPADHAAAAARLDRALLVGTDFELEYRLLRRDGAERSLYAIGHPVRDRSGHLVELIGTLVDVTDRVKAEQERDRLRQSQADLERVNRVSTLGELAASLAHEIRQPIAAALTNARTCVRWLNRSEPDLAEARGAAERAAGDATRAADIVTRVRSLFQKAPPQREPASLNALAGEVVSMLGSEAARHGVSVRTDLAPDLPAVWADRVQVQQVLLNLLLNAVEALGGAEGAREVVVQTRARADGCLVAVTDTGPGVAPGQGDRLFEAFYTTKAKGTGMGLAISRSIVESHGGRLWLEPPTGRGSTFCFTIPSSRAEEP